MSLQKEAELILNVLYREFRQKGKSLSCLKGSIPHEPTYYDLFYDPADHLQGNSVPNETFEDQGLKKDIIYRDYRFESKSSFDNAIFYLMITKEFIEDADPDLDITERDAYENQMSSENIIGKGSKEYIRLTGLGFMEADKNCSDSADEDFTRYFYFDDHSLYIKAVSGSPKVINLAKTKARETGVYMLLYALVKLLKVKGNRTKDNWCEAKITISELIVTIKEEFKISFNKDWIGNTKSNLVKKTIPLDLVNNYIYLSDCDRTDFSYSFKIKLPD